MFECVSKKYLRKFCVNCYNTKQSLYQKGKNIMKQKL